LLVTSAVYFLPSNPFRIFWAFTRFSRVEVSVLSAMIWDSGMPWERS
jgi:hypothetical protein